jgi:ABC-type nitrate/sulfonate/bicarbonate transport system permease component
MIQDARYLLLTERVILGMLVIGLLGFGMDRVMRYLERRLLPWYMSYR